MSTGTPINVKQENEPGTGEKPWIYLNTYAGPNVTLNFIVNGSATFDVQGTVVNIQRYTAQSDDILNLTDLENISTTSAATIAGQPLTALRINQTAGSGSVTVQLQQEAS